MHLLIDMWGFLKYTTTLPTATITKTFCVKWNVLKKNRKLNSPNNMDRNVYSTAHIRRPYERKD